MKRSGSLLTMGAIMTTSVAAWADQVTQTHAAVVETVVHKDTIVLTNGAIELGVSASVGRIVHVSRAGGPNLLWVSPLAAANEAQAKDQWVNWGGDKPWPAVQSLWPRFVPSGNQWPPDRIIDGQAWTILEQGDRHLVMQSPVNPDLQARVTRRIVLDDEGPGVRIHNSMERVGSSPIPLLIWTVSQVPHPAYTLLAIAADRPESERDRPVLHFGKAREAQERVELHDNAARFNVTRERSLKVGTFGTWVAGVWEDVAFAQYAHYDPAGSYPDRSNSQVYCDGNYVELELLSPQQHLQPGQKLDFEVRWRLLDLPAGMAADTAAVVRLIEAAAGD
jgi:hypothetical protein